MVHFSPRMRAYMAALNLSEQQLVDAAFDLLAKERSLGDHSAGEIARYQRVTNISVGNILSGNSVALFCNNVVRFVFPLGVEEGLPRAVLLMVLGALIWSAILATWV